MSEFYVYLYKDPFRNMEPFYVSPGEGWVLGKIRRQYAPIS
jgi:hypothetical protein